MAQEAKIIKVDLWLIVKILLVIFGLWLVYFLRDIILIIVAALFLAAIISPFVDWFEKRKIPRWLGALIVYLVIALVLAGTIFAAGPIVTSQGKLFMENLPRILHFSFAVFSGPGVEGQFQIEKWLGGQSEKLFSFLSSLAGMAFSLFMVFVIAFYISVEKRAVKQLIPTIIPRKYRYFVQNFLVSSQAKIGAWGRAQLVLCLVVGVLTYLGLLILRVRFALVLALIAGLTEIIPWIGPWLGAVPALIVGFAISPLKGLLVAVLYLVVQHVENQFVVPYVMHRAVGLNPLLTVIVLLIGGKVGGLLGMLLAVPITTVLSILIHDAFKFFREHGGVKSTVGFK